MKKLATLPLISVIIPVYNMEKYLVQCLDSIINQTYKNLEIIIINDGSSDNSPLIAENFATKDSRIKVFHFSNSGVVVSRNRGIKIAQGEYIGFVDSDDWIHPEFYEKLIYLLIDHDLDMIKCSAIETDGKTTYLLLPTQSQPYKVLGSNEPSENLKHYFEGILWTVIWNGLYKTNLVRQNLLLKRLYFEDTYLGAMFLYSSKRFMIINDTLYFYRINLSGITKSKRTYTLLDMAPLTLELIKTLKDRGYNDQKVFFKLYSKIATETFHFVRDSDDSLFKIISMKKTMYDFMCKYLNFRRKVFFKFLIIKKQIKIF